MAKEFNYTGTCIPERHFMVDTTAKLKEIMKLLEYGHYFTINRPRQYGKSTTMFLLAKSLEKKAEYAVIRLSFGKVGFESFKKEDNFIRSFLGQIQRQCSIRHMEDGAQYIAENGAGLKTLEDLGLFLTDFISLLAKKVVLMIDEVDSASNNELFLKFLSMLRDKYLSRNEGEDITFHSIILAGVHDVKTLKLKLRPEDSRKYNSPWNIAADFNINLAFSAREIETLLLEFTGERKISMDIPVIAEKLYYYTSGYPFLVSKLCYIIDTYINPQDEWKPAHLEEAVKRLLREENTNFESLIKNLENNKDLYELVYNLVIEGLNITFNPDNPQIHLGIVYGIFKNNTTSLTIHNKIYEQRIYNYMSSQIETSINMDGYNFGGQFLLPGNKLDFKKVLLKFQEFMKEQYSKKDTEFLEHNGRLIFLAFIKPIINGHGFDFKEVQISEEKRLDVVVTFYNRKYVIELKKWYGPEAHKNGLAQLSNYLESQKVDEGYLIIYDFRNKKEWKNEKLVSEGKNIFAVWV